MKKAVACYLATIFIPKSFLSPIAVTLRRNNKKEGFHRQRVTG